MFTQNQFSPIQKNLKMKILLRKYLVSGLVVSAIGFCAAAASAQNYLEDLTTNQTALFDFGAYSGNTTFTPDGLVIDIVDTGDSTFGGIGIAPVASVDLTGVTAIEVTARLDAGNASDLILAIREDDGFGGEGEFFSFTAAASNFTEGSFVTFSIDPTTGINGDSTNGVLDGPLNNTGLQSPFGTAAQNYTVQSINFVNATVSVPEPNLVSILFGLSVIFACRRRRKILAG